VAARTDQWSFNNLGPGATLVSPEFANPFLDFGPVVVAVERSNPAITAPTAERLNVALTVYRTGPGRFRIAATNIGAQPIVDMVVRWWALATVIV
jgi:hypothetical protein